MSYSDDAFEMSERFLESTDDFNKLPQETKTRMKQELAQSIQTHIEDWIDFEIAEAKKSLRTERVNGTSNN